MDKEDKKIRVLIVDDSFFMRQFLRELINSHSEMEVVGEAKDGIEAIIQAIALKPDVITMDFKMPHLTGAETTKNILQKVRPLPVILMVSAFTKEGAEETLQSLRAGAVDFIQKPSGELSLDIEKIKDELFAKIKVAAKAKLQGKVMHKSDQKVVSTKALKEEGYKKRKSEIKIVVIGSSTGGPPVVEDILKLLTKDLNVPIVIVQHMPENFTKSFAERLDKFTPVNVKEAEENDQLKPNQVIVAKGGFNIEIKKQEDQEVIHLAKGPTVFHLLPNIDVIFSNVAEVFGSKVLGIVLTGMGDDGTNGALAIKRAGGYVIVQDPKTCVVDSMPRSVIEAGLADEILGLEEIAKRIIELTFAIL